MKQPRYMKDFIRACPSVKHLLEDKPDNAMQLWGLLYYEFWQTLGRAPLKTKQILAFCRTSALPKSHPALREGVEYAFGEHLLDHPHEFPVLAKYLTSRDLDAFAIRLIHWNGNSKYSRRRKQLEKMIEAEQSVAQRSGKPRA